MYGLTRATVTLLAAAVAGFLIWIATQVGDSSNGEYWATYGLIAGAGLVMALSQLFGGWTKWGMPRISVPFLLIAFVPIAVASLWIIMAAEPGSAWLHRHVVAWTGDIHLRGFVNDLTEHVALSASAIGLVFGFSCAPPGPRRAAPPPADRKPVPDRRAADEPLAAEREEVGTAPRDGAVPRDREPVATTRTRGEA